MTSSTTTRRRPGGRGAGLTREQIVEQAIALMDADGTSGLTLRRLADRLGVEAPALYWHFPDKASLCREVVRTVGGQLEVTSVAGVGSTFIVELPAAAPATGPGQGESDRDGKALAQSGR